MTHYQLIRPIGSGGTSTVYLAQPRPPVRHTTRLPNDLIHRQSSGPQTWIAIKKLRADKRQTPEYIQLFRREAHIHRQLGHPHPNIVTVFDLEWDSDQSPYLILEYIDGLNLNTLATRAPICPEAAAYLARETLIGLAHAHARGIVHGDISLRNILISRTGEVKLSDFGMAIPLQNYSLLCQAESNLGFGGTIIYASPEVIQGAPPTPASDLYSFAASVYHILTGKPPFGYGSLVQINRRMAEWRIASLPQSVPWPLRELIMALLQYDPGTRGYSSAIEVDNRLLALSNRQQIRALLARDVDRARKRSQFLGSPAIGRPDVGRPPIIKGRVSETGTVPLSRRIPVDKSSPGSLRRAPKRKQKSAVKQHRTVTPPRQRPSRAKKPRRTSNWFVFGAGVLMAGIIMHALPDLLWLPAPTPSQTLFTEASSGEALSDEAPLSERPPGIPPGTPPALPTAALSVVAVASAKADLGLEPASIRATGKHRQVKTTAKAARPTSRSLRGRRHRKTDNAYQSSRLTPRLQQRSRRGLIERIPVNDEKFRVPISGFLVD